VGDILFEVLAIGDKPKKTRTGQYATGEDILQKLVGKHPIVDQILNYRELVKLKNTYIDSLPLMVNPATGRVHTTYALAATTTGRLSSNEPNLQNIPVRTEDGRKIRRAFIATPGHKLVSADYSQIELRLLAEIADVLIEILVGEFLLELDVVVQELHAQAHDVLEEVGVGPLVAILHVGQSVEMLLGLQDVLRDAGQANGLILVDRLDLEGDERGLNDFVGETVLAEGIKLV
jgi:hypothetical protein